MTFTTKFLLIIIALLSISFAGFVIYSHYETKNMLTQIQTSLVAQQTLVDGITRSSSTFATKADIDNLVQSNGLNLAAIQANLDSLKAQVSGINVISTSSNTTTQTGVGSTTTTPIPTSTGTAPTCDPFGYDKNIQSLSLNESFGTGSTAVSVPAASVQFNASQAKPWGYTMPQRTYSVDNVLGTNPDTGKSFVYNKMSISTGGQSYTIPIANSTYSEQVPTSTWSFFNPRLFLGIDGEVNVSTVPIKPELTPSLGLGVISYGQTKIDPTFSFAQVGLGYGAVSHKVQVQITPIMYNVGHNISTPLVHSTYIGPTLGVGFNGNVSIGAGLRVGL